MSPFWKRQQALEQQKLRILELERQHRQDLDRQEALAQELEQAQDTIEMQRHIIAMLQKSKGKRSGEGAAPYAGEAAAAGNTSSGPADHLPLQGKAEEVEA